MEAISKVWNSRCLRVVGRLEVYKLKVEDNLHSRWLKSQVELADKSKPWVSGVSSEYPPRVEIIADKECDAVFEVHPQFMVLPRHLYAFYRYMCNIAQYLTVNVDGIAQVSVSMKAETDETTDFRTPGGEEIYKQAKVAVKAAIAELSDK